MSGKEYTARSIEEALEKALNEMMLTREDIHYEVVQQPSKGFLGFGQKDAIVRVSKKVVEETKPEATKKEILKEKIEETETKNSENTNSVTSEAAPQKTEANAEPVIASAVEKEEISEAVQVVEQDAMADTLVKDAEVLDIAEETEEAIAARKEAMRAAEEKGRAFLAKIFEEMHLDVTIEVTEKSNYLVFDLQGDNLGILIGRRGDTLDALQFLLNLVINDKHASKVKGIIDIENYRAKREETLVSLGHKLAAKARKTGQKVILEPMNPQERRIIHMALQNDKRVKTYSEGEEPFRKVVIEPVAGVQKPYYKKSYNKNYHSGRKSYDRTSGRERKTENKTIEE